MLKQTARMGEEMATEFVTLRDSSEQSCHLLPPGENYSVKDTEAPANADRGFLYTPENVVYPRYEEIASFDHTDLSRNPIYDQYMRMNKVLVGNHGAQQLEQIYHGLKDECQPHYVVAAGWAAAESALVRTDITLSERCQLLDKAVQSWHNAAAMQRYIEAVAPEASIEYAYGHRIALDIAIAPLLADIIGGDVRQDTVKRVFKDCLLVAQSNAVYTNLASRNSNIEALAAHIGLGYECNGLLAFNRDLSQTWFVLPSMARCDSGYYNRNQTHDLMVVHQKYGVIKQATPVEIKAKPSARDRVRYEALLVRGKMHLSVEGKYTPDHTLRAITAVHEQSATPEERYIATTATQRFKAMVRDYYAGETLGKLAGTHTMTIFHNKEVVISRHPGLERPSAA